MIVIPHAHLHGGIAAPAVNDAMMAKSSLNRRQQGYEADEGRELQGHCFAMNDNAAHTRNGRPMITVAAGILKQNGRILICQRKRTGAFPLQWEFPGGKVEAGEDARTCVQRELLEELAIEADIGPEVSAFQYTYPNGFQVSLVFFGVSSYTGDMANQAFEQILWVEPGELANYDFLEADRALVARIARGELV
jgi:8-oxo-dGTP diphosphatase